jgi:hypothetical protein
MVRDNGFGVFCGLSESSSFAAEKHFGRCTFAASPELADKMKCQKAFKRISDSIQLTLTPSFEALSA